MRRRAASAALAVLAAACSSAGADEPIAAPSPTAEASPEPTTAPTTEPTPSPEPSPTPTEEEPPEVDLTAEDGDYRRVVEEILRFRAWLFAHPHRQDLVSVIYNEDCLCYEPVVGLLAQYVEANRWSEISYEVGEFEVTASDELTFRAIVTYAASGRLFEEGELVDEGTTEPVTEEWFLLREPTGRYRLAGVSEQ